MSSDVRSHWRSGMYSFEHEAVFALASADQIDPARWVPQQEDEVIATYFDDDNGTLARRGVMLSLYGMPSLPSFGFRLRVKETIAYLGAVRHSFAVTAPVQATAAATVLESFAETADSSISAVIARHLPVARIRRVGELLQRRQRFTLRDAQQDRMVLLSVDECTFTGRQPTSTRTYAEFSVLSWAPGDLALGYAIRDTLTNAADATPVRSKYEHLRGLDAHDRL